MEIKKLIKLLEIALGEEVRRDTQEGAVAELTKEVEYLTEENNRLKTHDKQLEVSVSQTNQIMKLEQEVSRIRARNVYLQERIEELTPDKAIPKYDFSEIPNDCEGQEFVDNVKKYLNMGKYN